MLYKKICIISATSYALLTYRVSGATYYVSSKSGSDYTYNGIDNTLNIYCDEQDIHTGYTFSCGNVKDCYFHCDEKKCGESAQILARNSDNLYVQMGINGQECLKNGNVYAPNNGNASFTTNAKKGFKGMNVHSGINTQSIIIDCDSDQTDHKDDCKEMNVYASTADFLKITIGDGLEFETAIVQCPINSPYNGPEIAPCIIDATNGIMKDISIVAPDGIPKGVYVTGSTATNVQVICDNVDLVNGAEKTAVSTFPFDTSSDCWWTSWIPTRATTKDPTIDPTNNPSPSPTNNPSSSPTADPTTDPTASPTNNPTYSPSPSPTASPTDNPTPSDQVNVINATRFINIIHINSNSTSQGSDAAMIAIIILAVLFFLAICIGVLLFMFYVRFRKNDYQHRDYAGNKKQIQMNVVGAYSGEFDIDDREDANNANDKNPKTQDSVVPGDNDINDHEFEDMIEKNKSKMFGADCRFNSNSRYKTDTSMLYGDGGNDGYGEGDIVTAHDGEMAPTPDIGYDIDLLEEDEPEDSLNAIESAIRIKKLPISAPNSKNMANMDDFNASEYHDNLTVPMKVDEVDEEEEDEDESDADNDEEDSDNTDSYEEEERMYLRGDKTAKMRDNKIEEDQYKDDIDVEKYINMAINNEDKDKDNDIEDDDDDDKEEKMYCRGDRNGDKTPGIDDSEDELENILIPNIDVDQYLNVGVKAEDSDYVD